MCRKVKKSNSSRNLAEKLLPSNFQIRQCECNVNNGKWPSHLWYETHIIFEMSIVLCPIGRCICVCVRVFRVHLFLFNSASLSEYTSSHCIWTVGNYNLNCLDAVTLFQSELNSTIKWKRDEKWKKMRETYILLGYVLSALIYDTGGHEHTVCEQKWKHSSRESF